MSKFSLAFRPILSSLVITILIPSCKTVDYVMWEWNPLEKKQSPAQSAPAPNHQYTQPIQHPSYIASQISTPTYVSHSQLTRPAVTSPVNVTPSTSTQLTQVAPPVYVKAAPKPTPKPVIQIAKAPVKKSGKVGKVTLVNGLAVAPANAPQALKDAVRAGNDMQSMPYVFGGGHAKLDNDVGYDCSGTVSYVLRAAGLMKGSNTSIGFLSYGQSGEGEYLTVWAKKGHVFLVVGGLRLDTGGSLTRTGPRWKPAPRSMKGFIPRHPAGH